jgi:hypothetical protein
MSTPSIKVHFSDGKVVTLKHDRLDANAPFEPSTMIPKAVASALQLQREEDANSRAAIRQRLSLLGRVLGSFIFVHDILLLATRWPSYLLELQR